MENEESTIGYKFQGFVLSSHMVTILRRYIDERVQPGHFLTAVICNDLSEACARGDMFNLRNLPAFIGYLYNKAPSQCWGSKDKMNAWLNGEQHFESR